MKTIRLFLILFTVNSYCYSQDLNKEELIHDIRQLSNILESSHPDPYLYGGGKIAYHTRLQKLITEIPDSGMNKSEFQKMLLPFVAAVGDGHTRIHVKYKKDHEQPGGIPLLFKIVEKSLYVSGVVNPSDEHLIGSVLISVEGIPFNEIFERVINLRGVDNEYGGLTLLEDKKYLWHKEQIEHIIPELQQKEQVVVKLRLPNKKEETFSFNRDFKIENDIIGNKSSASMPDMRKKEFNFCFVGSNENKIAILKIDGMVGFRENFELVGLDNKYRMNQAKHYYKRYNGVSAPEDKSKILHGIPTATDLFISMVEEMKSHETEALIVDLRNNDGGNSTLAQFLIYFLFGKDALVKNVFKDSEGAIVKLSNLYYEQNQYSVKKRLDAEYLFEEGDKYDSTINYSELDEFYKKIPTFYNKYKSNSYSGYYCPPNVYVICSPKTFSSGFTLMSGLHELGCSLIGTPPSVSQGKPGWILNYKLDNSNLTGWVACKYYPPTSNKFINGIYLPDYILTYEKLKQFNFDPNSEIKYAIELINE